MDAILTKKAEELAKDLAGQATTCHSNEENHEIRPAGSRCCMYLVFGMCRGLSL